MWRELKIPNVCSYPSTGPVHLDNGHRLLVSEATNRLRQIAAMEPGDLMAVYVARVALGVRQPPEKEEG